MRRSLPLYIAFAAGILVIIARYLAFPAMVSIQVELDQWSMYSSAAAFLLGIINLTIIHVSNIKRRRTTWGASVVLLVCMFSYLLFGLFAGKENQYFSEIYDATINPLGAAMYALLAFYLLSASYRSFKMKSLEATILLVAGLIGILGNAPIGAAISGFIPEARSWMTSIINTSAMRAVTTGTSLGAYAAMVRILLGIERSYLGGRGD